LIGDVSEEGADRVGGAHAGRREPQPPRLEARLCREIDSSIASGSPIELLLIREDMLAVVEWRSENNAAGPRRGTWLGRQVQLLLAVENGVDVKVRS
jgi:hypothetical protein